MKKILEKDARGGGSGKDTTNRVLTHILLNSETLFSTDHIGVKILLKGYIRKIEELLKDERTYQRPELVRVCLRILSTVICIPNNFICNEKLLYSNGKADAGTEISTSLYNSINFYKQINKTLSGLVVVICERSEGYNLQLGLWYQSIIHSSQIIIQGYLCLCS